jgi:hypothetical protein
VQSPAGGGAFTAPVQLSTASSNPEASGYNNLQEQFIGDYLDIVAGPASAWPYGRTCETARSARRSARTGRRSTPARRRRSRRTPIRPVRPLSATRTRTPGSWATSSALLLRRQTGAGCSFLVGWSGRSGCAGWRGSAAGARHAHHPGLDTDVPCGRRLCRRRTSYQSAWTAVPLCSVATVPLAPHATAADRSGQLSVASCQCLAMPAGDS